MQPFVFLLSNISLHYTHLLYIGTMKASVLSTLGVFTTFCQPVSSCSHVTPFPTDANSHVKGIRFENAGQVGPPQWSGSMIDKNFCRPRPTQAPINLHRDSSVYRPIDLGIQVDELVYATMELPITMSVMEQLRFHTLSGCSRNGEEYSLTGSRAVFKASGTPHFPTCLAAILSTH